MDEIRLVSQLLEDVEPPAQAVARGRQRLADYAAQDAARPEGYRPRHRPRRPTGAWRDHPVLTGAVIAAAAAVAVAVALPLAGRGTTGRQAQPGTQMSRAALTAAILTALGAAADDIVWDHTDTWVANGQHMYWDGWAWPWEPRPGQQVLEHVSYRDAPDTAQQYLTLIAHQPPAGSDAGATYGYLVKLADVDYTSRTWQEETFQAGKTYPQSFVPSVAAIRAEVAAGDWSVVGHGVVNGHQAIELRWKHGIGPDSRSEAGTLELWVDATTYLPLKQILNETDSSKQYVVDTFQFLPPTQASLATFHVVIPPGFTKITPLPPSQHHPPFSPSQGVRIHRPK